jgi:hypothetical protein
VATAENGTVAPVGMIATVGRGEKRGLPGAMVSALAGLLHAEHTPYRTAEMRFGLLEANR